MIPQESIESSQWRRDKPLTGLATRVWQKWWFSSTNLSVIASWLFTSLGLLPTLLERTCRADPSQCICLSWRNPRNRNELREDQKSLVTNVQRHEWRQTRNTGEQACKLGSKPVNASCFSHWLLRLHCEVMSFRQCICTTLHPLPRINDPPFLELASLFKSQRMAIHKRD